MTKQDEAREALEILKMSGQHDYQIVENNDGELVLEVENLFMSCDDAPCYLELINLDQALTPKEVDVEVVADELEAYYRGNISAYDTDVYCVRGCARHLMQKGYLTTPDPDYIRIKKSDLEGMKLDTSRDNERWAMNEVWNNCINEILNTGARDE